MKRYKILKLNYEINHGEKKIKIFGSDFVKNGAKPYKIIFENKIYDLVDTFELPKKKIEKFENFFIDIF